MKVSNVIDRGLLFFKRNSPALLSSTAIAGVVTTSYLTGKATMKMAHGLAEDTPWKDNKEIAREYWRLYVPAAASGVVTIACIVGTTRVGNKRAMAAQAAFVISERAFTEYRDKVVEEIGEGKERKIRDKIAEDRIKNNPPSNVIVTGKGEVLCCELYTGRYFSSDMQTLKKAENELNAQLLRQDCVSLEEWYYILGLPSTQFCSDIGWNSDKLMELEFTTALAEDGTPCLAFSYNYTKPLYEGLFR